MGSYNIIEGDFNREVTDSQAKNIVAYAWVKIKFPCETIATSGRVGGYRRATLRKVTERLTWDRASKLSK